MNAEITPFGSTPSARQIQWHATEIYSIVHFGLNTFSGKEWGYGDESPEWFNPSACDPEQWARTCAATGIRGLILVCKHHDGFCLWPTRTTEYNVSKSPWKNGQGDLVAETAAACRKHGLKFGVYLSPWDRHHAEYGREGYVAVYHRQLEELLTGYGELFEVWFDGANGGDGFYGGTRERRSIDPATYYQWKRVHDLVRRHQPNACMFGVFDIRYVGNEDGRAEETCWATQSFLGDPVLQKSVHPSRIGDRRGDWMPAECDFPLRKGWFFHPNDEPKSPEGLFERFLTSVGHGGTMNIGLAPDRRGLIHDDDLAALTEWKTLMDETFSYDRLRAAGVKVTANSGTSGTERVLDGDADTFWSPGEDVRVAELTFEFPQAMRGNLLSLREFLPLGQRVDSFTVEACEAGEWRELGSGTSIGHRRLFLLPSAEIMRLRVRLIGAVGPAIREVSLFRMPIRLLQSGRIDISRDRTGHANIRTTNSGLLLRYTTDGTVPRPDSPVYDGPFPFRQGGLIRAGGFLSGEDGAACVEATATFGLDRSGWRVVCVSLDSPFANEGSAGVEKLLDDDPETYWHTYHSDKALSSPPHEVVLDMGRRISVQAFTFLPRLAESEGIPDQYAFYLGEDGMNWTLAAEGEFANIKASPDMRTVSLPEPMAGQFLKFVARHVIDDGDYVAVAGLGVIENGDTGT